MLLERDPLNPGTLAELLNVSPSTVTGLCDRLAARSLIERALDAGNRREVLVRLSSGGKALIEAAGESPEQAWSAGWHS